VAAPSGEHAAEELLAVTVAVRLGGVEERDPRVERRVDDVLRPRLVEPPAEVVAAEADDRDDEIRRADVPRAHALEPTGDDVEQVPVLRLAGRGRSVLVDLVEPLDRERCEQLIDLGARVRRQAVAGPAVAVAVQLSAEASTRPERRDDPTP